jgi:hypothetical protein
MRSFAQKSYVDGNFFCYEIVFQTYQLCQNNVAIRLIKGRKLRKLR